MQNALKREESIQWFHDARTEAIKEIKSQGAGKVRYKCPLCEALGDFTILPGEQNSAEKYYVSYYCAECGFRIDDTGLKYYPPPPPPKHLRRPNRK